MAERFDQLYGDLAEAEQHTKERLKGYYDRLAEEASMKSEEDSKRKAPETFTSGAGKCGNRF